MYIQLCIYIICVCKCKYVCIYIYICTSTQWYTCNYIYTYILYIYITIHKHVMSCINTLVCLCPNSLLYSMILVQWLFSRSRLSFVTRGLPWRHNMWRSKSDPGRLSSNALPPVLVWRSANVSVRNPGIEKMGVSGNGVYLLFYSHFKRENDD